MEQQDRPRVHHNAGSRIALPRLLLLAVAVALAAAAVSLTTSTQPASAATTLRQVEVGQNHACVLDGSGAVTCWGEDSAGQVSDWGKWRYRSQRFAQISAGSFFTCGILTNGSVMCWGYPEQENGAHREGDHRDWEDWAAAPDAEYAGWVNTPPGDVEFKPGSLSVGNYHACAIKTSGELACWGKAGDARLVIPTDEDGEAITDWTLVEAGWAHACAIREGGSVTCFGRATHGRADGPAGAGPFTDVTLGQYNGCALATDGSVECWGAHAGLAQYNPLINTAPAGVTFTAIEMSTTDFHSCGIARDGAIHCWGIVLSNAAFPRVTPPSGSFASISVGTTNSCALDSSGSLTCWGDDNSSLLEPPSGAFTQTSGGTDFSCALKTDQTIECWGGRNASKQLDAPSGTFTLVSAGHTHACAIRPDGTVACWGGVSGDPPTPHASAVAPAGTFTTLDAGGDLTCGIRTDGTLECWGDASYDRLDEPDGAFSRVAVGATHVCAIKSDQGILCWGETTFFDREGDGVPDDIDGLGNHTTTTPPAGEHKYVDISAGAAHTCAIRDDGRAVCWGYHADGRNQVPGYASSPQGFSGQGFADIATGGPNNCAIRSSDGSLACWNTEKPQYWPNSEILAMTGFQSLGAGVSHMCAIDSGDGLVCWGVAGIVPIPSQLGSDIVEGQILARRLASGRVEFGFRPEGEALILPERRFFPADARVNQWLVSSDVVRDGDVLGRITARLRPDGRIEVAFNPADGDRVLPKGRFVPASAGVNRWLWSTTIEVPLPAGSSTLLPSR